MDISKIAAHDTPKSKMIYHENPESLHVSTLDKHCYFIPRAEALVKRDINRPCVVFWSLGNESGYGTNMLAAGELVKSLDNTRLLQKYYDNPPNSLDHYP